MTVTHWDLEDSSTVVVRLRANARTWRAAARTDDDAPPAARALLAGRTRIELSAQEARTVFAWARTVPGWESDGGPALEAYPLSGGARMSADADH
jgi:hypothetical protein